MPAISPHDRILVTGANGYIGLWAVHRLLQTGYRVRAAVRTEDKAAALATLFAVKLPGVAHNLECTIVGNILADHAYDDAIRDVAGVIHVASPMTLEISDPRELIGPAIGGTTNLLESALAHGKDLKRIVMTSSVKALLGDVPGTYDESYSAEWAVSEVERNGKETNPEVSYCASKVLAEKAAVDFYGAHKSEISWDISIINCGWCYGPTLTEPAAPADLPSTSALVFPHLFVIRDETQVYPRANNYVDVRDAAEVHVRALEVEAAGGQRIAAVSQWCNWQDWLNKAAELKLLPKLDKWNPERADVARKTARECTSDKAERILGTHYRTLEDTLRDTLDDYRSRGWIAQWE